MKAASLSGAASVRVTGDVRGLP